MRNPVRLAILGSVLLLVIIVVGSQVCVSAYFRYGISPSQCPDGVPRLTVSATALNLMRGEEASVRVSATAHFVTRGAQTEQTSPLMRFSPALFLVDPQGQEHPLTTKEGWNAKEGSRQAEALLDSALQDGDYRLRVRVKSGIGDETVDIATPLYARAKIHVITDRPLYQPGDTLHFRAVVLKALDLSPLDHRPGSWVVENPNGETVLEESSPAGAWGVASGSFPLDRGADPGVWKVRWVSAGASDEARVRVEPFILPRFRIEAQSARAFYRAGDRPSVHGSVLYSSGAPVSGARIDISWDHEGDWPPPTPWLDRELPRHATTGADGHFTLELPQVPADLKGQVTLRGNLAAVDAAGDRVAGQTSLLLSEDAIAVSAVTELADGLVEGFNNRVYLRVTSADGQVLAGTPVVVRRAWDRRDKGVEAQTDADGVVSLQMDPGSPVNVIIPAMPIRPPQPEPSVARGSVTDLIAGAQPSLADARAMDGWLAPLETCARLASGREQVQLMVRANAAGAVTDVTSLPRPLAACAAQGVRSLRLAAGAERLLSLDLQFNDVNFPKLVLSAANGEPSGLDEALNAAARRARHCVPDSISPNWLTHAIAWRTRAGDKSVSLSWVPDGRRGVAFPFLPCIEAELARVELADKAPADAMGLVRVEVEPSQRRAGVAVPSATVMMGYEYDVTARTAAVPSEELGRTKLRLRPGVVPAVRLRATPVLAEAGKSVEVELLRGPSFVGDLPKELVLVGSHGEKLTAPFDPKRRAVQFTLPASAQGWFSTEWANARSIIYVQPPARLAVAIKAEKERYAPGQQAKLSVRTEVDGHGAPAAVGLIGVDESLGQLAPLPGPDELARLQPVAAMSSSAFNVLDARALALGRVKGPNAAAAIVTRVIGLPSAELDSPGSGNGASTFDPSGEMADHFYTVLAELHAQAAAWEAKAGKDEQMNPRTLATLWSQALDACAQRHQPVTDGYGRRMRLSELPADLLALTDPRSVVVSKTRLPEDMENWNAWVAKEQP